MAFRIARAIIRFVVRLICRPEVQGMENMPADARSLAVASNHLGRLDAVLPYFFTDRTDLIMLVAEKYAKYRLVRWFARRLDAIFIDRFNADFAVMRQALKRLENGGVLVLAPEGTRSTTGALIEGRDGASYLAAKAGVPIVPVGLAGTEDNRVMGHLKRLRRVPIAIRVGTPFTLPPLPKEGRDAALKAYTDEIMCRIAALLPPEYRGFYAKHPRLEQLLSE